MAEVYLARSPGAAGFSKLVALKRVRPILTDQACYLRMFREEVKILSRLSHPNIPQLLDLRTDGGALYYAMEYVDGLSLSRLRRLGLQARRRLPLECAISIVCDVAAALHHAHTRTSSAGRPMRIVHRDVAPGNILVGFEGQVKVIDFGVASAEPREAITQDRLVKGSLGYMSPEQCLGRALERRTDIFSLGIVLYELTTGTRPYSGVPYEIMKQTAYRDVAAPSQVRPGYPAALESIVLRAMQRSPSRRYATMEELHDDLRRFAADWQLRLTSRARADYLSALGPSRRAQQAARPRRFPRQTRLSDAPPVHGAAAADGG